MVEPEESGEPAPEGSIAALVCSNCRFPIVLSQSGICPDKFESTMGKAVYAYELDVLDKEAWCYSATNAHDNRFDVIRVTPPGNRTMYV